MLHPLVWQHPAGAQPAVLDVEAERMRAGDPLAHACRDSEIGIDGDTVHDVQERKARLHAKSPLDRVVVIEHVFPGVQGVGCVGGLAAQQRVTSRPSTE